MSEHPPPANGEDAAPSAEEAARGIGVDKWVAQADERRERQPGVRGQIAYFWGILPPAGKLALLAPARSSCRSSRS